MTDFVFRFAGADDFQPVLARSLRGGGGDDLDDLSRLQNRADGHDHAVDFGTRHAVADLAVNGKGKVDARRAVLQADNVALRRENENFVLEYVDFQGLQKFVAVGVALFGLNQRSDPL